ncbi:MAG: flagellar basal body-associated FliL family protein [Pirellulales bacterium]
MADEVIKEQEAEAEAIESPKRSRRGLLRAVQAVAFVSVIVIVEIVVGSMLAPSAEETTRLAQELAAASAGKTAEENDPHAAKESDSSGGSHSLREVELGIYNVTRFNPATNTTLAIDFELYGTVLADDVGEFQHHFDQSNARVREQVTMTLHGAQSADLTDAGLGLIKRRILEKTNRALGEPLLKEVLFSKFNFVER